MVYKIVKIKNRQKIVKMKNNNFYVFKYFYLTKKNNSKIQTLATEGLNGHFNVCQITEKIFF